MVDSANKLPPERLTPQSFPVRWPLTVEWLGDEVKLRNGTRADARIRLQSRSESRTFLIEYKNSWTGATLKAAIEKVKKHVELSPGDLPMVVLPYLSIEMLDTLMASGVSGFSTGHLAVHPRQELENHRLRG